MLHLVAASGPGRACPEVLGGACLDINGSVHAIATAAVIDGEASFSMRMPADLIGQRLNLQVANPDATLRSSALLREVVHPDGDRDGDTLANEAELELGTDPRSADSDGDLLDDAFEVLSGGDPLDCEDPLADEDSDGLSDCDERVHGTRVDIADTDGDGFSDKEEIDNGFSPDNNNFKFNPRIADLPRIEISFASVPSIAALIEKSSGSVVEVTAERSTSESNAVSQSVEETNSHAVEYTETVGGSVTTGVEASFPGGVSASAEATVSYESSKSTTTETSMTWNETQTTENTEAYSRALAEASEEGSVFSGGVLAVLADVRNDGNLAYTIENMVVTAYMTTPVHEVGEPILSPVGTLSFDTTQNAFPAFSLGPNQSARQLTFVNDGLDVGTTEALLLDSTNLQVGISAYELTDEFGRSLSHHQTKVFARTASILIDYDGADAPLDSEAHQVATNLDPSVLRIGAVEAFEDILALPFTLDVDGRVVSVRGMANDSARDGAWHVVRSSTDGVFDTVDQFGPDDDYDLRLMELKSGDTLHLVYIEDRDGDGLGLRQERAYRTDPDNPDTDSDGLLDGEEIENGTDPTTPNKVPVSVEMLGKFDALGGELVASCGDSGVELAAGLAEAASLDCIPGIETVKVTCLSEERSLIELGDENGVAASSGNSAVSHDFTAAEGQAITCEFSGFED